ncbi:DUF2188 domain-containing protein [Wenxinia marina]|uniref:DUF2188 domain-containing protein n=1 Tax=Wenxinia marina TaxID=390641 RepID=UPI0009DA59A6|nr:DUF2188 domain-containing protein [Wenxinia marina]GGL63524.1 hypothetical protein GCM10011392_17780 [Wenxinia marina]
MATKGLHVTPRGGKWAVRQSGSSRAAVVVETQGEAIQIAREKVKKAGGEIYVHGRDGRIRERSSYEKESYPQKG